MAIKPEVRVFIQALRNGKSGDEAFAEYCWAKQVLPNRKDDYERGSKAVAWTWLMCDAMAVDAFKGGKTDEEIAEAFAEGLDYDRERDILWRAMEKHERPSAGALIRAMSKEDKEKAGELLGYATMARLIASR